MKSLEERQKIKDFLKWHTVSQAAVHFKLSRATIYHLANTIPTKSLESAKRKKEIAALSKTLPVKQIAKLYGISQQRVYVIIKEQRKA